mmetsp:Transcript_43543/g.51255  ORF Transcript_43543/g.51255 Transcript_43543/m.51255 type:complete len:304 (-) Transcript_43543:58-969(-)
MITCGPYIVKQTLGKGGFATVKLAEHNETGVEYAIKFMRRDRHNASVLRAFQEEVSVMAEIDHENTIRMFDYSDDATYTLPDGRSMPVYYIALEYAACGELFDVVVSSGKFNEKFARHFFHQLIEGTGYLHGKGIVHRDIKPENILLNDNFNLKLTDYGFATHDETSSTKQGTVAYLAPEVFVRSEFETRPLDIFAAGVVLFIMIKGAPPFNAAKVDDRLYSVLCQNSSQFWALHSRRVEGTFSDEFKELIESMLDYDSERRITVEGIKMSSWYNGPLPTPEELEEEINLRKKKMEGVEDQSI